MATVRAVLPLLAFLLLSAVPSAAQTFKEFGSWQYVKGGGSEAIYAESTDSDRTFSLGVACEAGEPSVALTFLVASSADDTGLDPDRFAPDGEVVTRLDGEAVGAGDWSFSTRSETFVNERPDPFLSALKNADAMTLQARDADGVTVGTYAFDLQETASALDALSCYADEAAG